MLGIANLHTMDNNGIRIQVETRFFFSTKSRFFLNCVPFIIVREVCMWMEVMGGGGVAPKVNVYSFATQSASCLPSNYGLHENVQ